MIKEGLYYTKEHEWVEVQQGMATIGITDFAQNQLGDIVYAEIDTLDEELEAGDVFGTIEAVKTVSDLFMPVSGKVVDMNPKGEEEPEVINSDPYGDGWLIIVEMSDESELDNLLSPEEYEKLIS